MQVKWSEDNMIIALGAFATILLVVKVAADETRAVITAFFDFYDQLVERAVRSRLKKAKLAQLAKHGEHGDSDVKHTKHGASQ